MKRRKDSDDELGIGADEPTPKRSRSARKPEAQDVVVNGSSNTSASRGTRHVSDEDIDRSEDEDSSEDITADTVQQPSQRTPRKTPTKTNGTTTPQKGLLGKKLFSTPKSSRVTETNGTPRIARNANRSARRKSTRALIERTILGTTSDNDEEEGDLADQIYGSDEDEDVPEDDNDAETIGGENAPETPSRKRGRPKGSKSKQRSLSPISHDLPPHEQYFVQNRPGRVKTSNNTLANLKLLDHEEYFTISRRLKDHHAKEVAELAALYEKSFNQWQFELSQDFNLCIYGWGSKRSLLMKFAEYIYVPPTDSFKHSIVVVNGYVPSLTIRDVFNTVASAVAEPGVKLGAQPAEMLERLFSLIEEDPNQQITLIINSIDRAPLRRAATQTLLSRLSAHRQVRLVASADHPQFPLLWDASLRSTFNFVFHECATFKPYSAEVDVVDEVHELLGRSGRRVGGKDGVIFVLKSLPVNATNLFKILIAEQLAGMGDGPVQVIDEDDDDDDHDGRNDRSRKQDEGVEYRALYQKAVEEFICSNDMGFRSLLKEFHDHQMIQRKKDMLGTEYLFVPFRKEELESILEDISS